MTKYHENHSYENCRLIKINENFTNDVWREILKKIGLDLLCVAAHYSKRYENSDKFIENNSEEELKTYTYYLKNKNSTAVVNEFCNKYIVESVVDYKMEWRNLHFVWKQFLFSNNFPNVIYSNTLKNILKEKYIYNEETDSFGGITSKYLPIHSDFIKFWDNTISFTTLNTNLELFDDELEIDEICSLFKYWVKNNLTNGNCNISEENVLKILKHFFPTVEIIENKFVLNVNCSLWNKIEDINNSFEYIKLQILNEKKIDLVSFDDMYYYYSNYCKNKLLKFIVSKRFFEKYLYYKLSSYIIYEKFIETDWIKS
jgi:hypothetical protein